jgi:hypothetical protein
MKMKIKNAAIAAFILVVLGTAYVFKNVLLSQVAILANKFDSLIKMAKVAEDSERLTDQMAVLEAALEEQGSQPSAILDYAKELVVGEQVHLTKNIEQLIDTQKQMIDRKMLGEIVSGQKDLTKLARLRQQANNQGAINPSKASRVSEMRLFSEYPLAAADIAAHPIETRSALWVSFQHIPVSGRVAAFTPWRPVARLHSLDADGFYRLDCRGPVMGHINRLLSGYPYAIAPGEKIDSTLADAYRQVSEKSPFRVCIVRGDWLLAALAGEPTVSQYFGPDIPSKHASEYLEAMIPTDVIMAPFPAGSRSQVTAPTLINHRELEKADQGGHSLFVRWAMASGAGIPVY